MAAEQYSDTYTLQTAAVQSLLSPYQMSGKFRICTGKIVAAGTWTTSNLGYLFIVRPQIFRVMFGYMETDGLGTSCTIALGYTGAVDAIIGATAMATATRTYLPKFAANGLDIGGKTIYATLAGASATDAKILQVVLFGLID